MNAPQKYEVSAHFAAFGKRPLSTILLERDALALGLSTHRIGGLEFACSDSSGRGLIFSRTGSVLNASPAAMLTRNKHTTRLLLQQAGVPAPSGRRFSARDSESAVEYAQELGYPVVFKPLQGTEGKGVVTNIQNTEELVWAFNSVSDSPYANQDVMVEEHLEGETYRAIVIDGEVVSVLIARKGAVTGDGVHTVRELIKQRQELRMTNPHLLGRPIPVNDKTEHLLQRQGASLDAVLPKDIRVFFTFGSNTHQGGEPAQVIDEVHPSILAACSRAAAAIPGLGFAGLDFIIPDISQPLRQQRAGICEINSVPAADSHEYPLYGRPIPVTRRLIEASARRADVSVSSSYSERVEVELNLQGKFGKDYVSWLTGHAESMGLQLESSLTGDRTAGARTVGSVDHVAILVSLAFLGPKGSAIQSIVTTHAS